MTDEKGVTLCYTCSLIMLERRYQEVLEQEKVKSWKIISAFQKTNKVGSLPEEAQ